MIRDFEQRVAQYLDSLKDVALVTVQEGTVSAYYIKEPGTRIMSTLVIFSPEGIVLQGDFTPGHHGNVSSIGYGLGWFAGELSADYLAEKFLEQGWHSELAVEHLHDPYYRDGETPETCAELDKLANEVDDGDVSQQDIYDRFDDLGLDTSDGVPGWGYDPNEVAVLAAIQRKFAQLWARRQPCPSNSTPTVSGASETTSAATGSAGKAAPAE